MAAAAEHGSEAIHRRRNPNDRAPADAFAPKILAQAQGFAGGQPPDFANASFAELFAWSLAQPAAE